MSVNLLETMSQTDSSRQSNGSGAAVKVKLLQATLQGLKDSLKALKEREGDLDRLRSFVDQGFWLKVQGVPEENEKRRKVWFECSHIGSNKVVFQSEPSSKRHLAWEEEVQITGRKHFVFKFFRIKDQKPFKVA
jgi:hypothetical protein